MPGGIGICHLDWKPSFDGLWAYRHRLIVSKTPWGSGQVVNKRYLQTFSNGAIRMAGFTRLGRLESGLILIGLKDFADKLM